MTVPDERQTAPVTELLASSWIAFRHKAFRVVWIATVVANVGTWMYNAASGWLMTSLEALPAPGHHDDVGAGRNRIRGPAFASTEII